MCVSRTQVMVRQVKYGLEMSCIVDSRILILIYTGASASKADRCMLIVARFLLDVTLQSHIFQSRRPSLAVFLVMDAAELHPR